MGMYFYLLAVIGYANTVVTYGFNLTATKNISQNINRFEKLKAIFSETISSKLLLSMVSAAGVYLFLQSSKDVHSLRFGLVICVYLLSSAFIVDWLFQGLEQMYFAALLNVIAKAVFFVAVAFTADLTLETVLVYLSISNIISAILYIALAKYKHGLSFSLSSFYSIKRTLNEGCFFFLSQMLVLFYTTINVIVLKHLSSLEDVSVYSFAERLFYFFSAVFFPLSSALFPRFASLYQADRKKFEALFHKVFKIYFIAGIGFAAFCIGFAPYMVMVIAGNENSTSIICLRIMGLAIPLVPLGALYSQLSVITNASNKLVQVLLIVACVNVILCYPVIKLYSIYGLASLTVVVYFLVAFLLHFKLKPLIR